MMSKKRFDKMKRLFIDGGEKLRIDKKDGLYGIEIPDMVAKHLKDFDKITIKRIGRYDENKHWHSFYQIEIMKKVGKHDKKKK